ncbi:hypothetical protein RN001_005917 [Aquatica leii]|uniref:Uncharacterized protein n=1 Tax=Aquatica leii TaxID=1421715 RepID=A0AAN7SQ06_9COLE|nr:hypothetical protein RN001_005917 [Aquatica leii]
MGTKFSWLGQKKKRIFKELKLAPIIKAVRLNKTTNDTTDDAIIKSIMDWSIKDSLPLDFKGNIRLDRLTEDQLMCLYEDHSDEEPDPFADDGNETDAEWLPPNAEDSDAEDVAEIDRMADAIKVASECDDEISEADDDQDDSHTSTECGTPGKFTCRDQTIWNKSPLATSQTSSYNIIRESGGPHRRNNLYR